MQLPSHDRISEEPRRQAEPSHDIENQITAIRSMQIRIQKGTMGEKDLRHVKSLAEGIVLEIINGQKDVLAPTSQRRNEICEQLGSELFLKVKETPRASAGDLHAAITKKIRAVLLTDAYDKKHAAIH